MGVDELLLADVEVSDTCCEGCGSVPHGEHWPSRGNRVDRRVVLPTVCRLDIVTAKRFKVLEFYVVIAIAGGN